jgi:hypothetical protein
MTLASSRAVMSCQQIDFTHGSCLVEIRPEPDAAGPSRFTARVAVLEEDGAIVRPIVSHDGRGVEIRGTDESAALQSAIEYLEDRFGQISEPEHACSLGSATIGQPFRVPR